MFVLLMHNNDFMLLFLPKNSAYIQRITQYRLTKYATILNQILIFGWVVLLEVTFYLNPVINILIYILLRLMYSKWIDQEDIKTQSHPEYCSLGLIPYGSLLI